MRLLHLHAGMHKTGSTSIQAYLERNSEFFLAKGYRVVNNADPWNGSLKRHSRSYNCFYIANILIRNTLQTNVRISGKCRCLSPRERLKQASKVNAYLRNLREDRGIISAESFSFLRTAEEKELYDVMFEGFAVHPIVFFREKNSWLASWGKQLTKHGLIHHRNMTPNSGIYDLSPDSWMVKYDEVRAFFGSSATFLDYDDLVRQEQSVLPGFLRAVGLDAAECPTTGDVFANRSGASSDRAASFARRFVRRWLAG